MYVALLRRNSELSSINKYGVLYACDIALGFFGGFEKTLNRKISRFSGGESTVIYYLSKKELSYLFK